MESNEGRYSRSGKYQSLLPSPSQSGVVDVLGVNLHYRDVEIAHLIMIVGIHLGLSAIDAQSVVKGCNFLN